MVHRVGGEHDTLAGGVPDGPGHHQLAQRHAQPLSYLRSGGNSKLHRALSEHAWLVLCEFNFYLTTLFQDMKY